MRFDKRIVTGVAAGAAALGLVSAGAGRLTAQDSGGFQVILSGLDNPRGLAFAGNGALYVAEAGRGGDGPCLPGEGGPDVCLGRTGAVTRLYRGVARRVITGLPSLAAPDGSGATGPHDVSIHGNGNPQVVIGLGDNPDVRMAFPDDNPIRRLGFLAELRSGGNRLSYTHDVSRHELKNPDRDVVDSNPYSVLADDSAQIIADAGGNSLLRAAKNGTIKTLTVFPPQLVDAPPFLGLPPGTQIPAASVPTCVAIGPDSAYYVGELTGFPFPVGGARVWRVPQNGRSPQVYRSGFTNVLDIAFARDGSLYVLEHAANGLLSGDPASRIIRVSADGSQRTTIADTGLTNATAMAIGRDGALYVSNNGTSAGTGQVVRIAP